MEHLNSVYRKSDYFLSNNLISIDREASNSSKEYYFVGKNKISVWIDEHGRFNCSNCGGFKKDAICSHVLASLLYRRNKLNTVIGIDYAHGKDISVERRD